MLPSRFENNCFPNFLQFLSVLFTIMELMLFTLCKINTYKHWQKTIKARLALSVQFWTEIFRSWLSFSLRPSVLRHVMYTIVARYDNERETWSKSDDTLCLGKVSETNFYETSIIRIIKNLNLLFYFERLGRFFTFWTWISLESTFLQFFHLKKIFQKLCLGNFP
jgi:hypothetical protein